MRAHEGAVAFLNDPQESPDSAGVSANTVMQLYHRVERVGMPDAEQARVETALKGVAAYDLTRAIAARAGRLDGVLLASGRAIDPADVIVCATALERHEAVVTRNKNHFGRIPGLRVLSY